MAQSNNILQELIELDSSLANSVPENVYTVPSGYFDGLASLVLNRVKALESNTASEEIEHLSFALSGFSKEMPFSIPAGYFEDLEDRLMQGVLENGGYLQKTETVKEELASISPFLSSLNKQMPYTLPEGYFEALSPRMQESTESNLAKVIPIRSGKVVSISHRKWFRLAAAAVIAAVIGLGAFFYSGGQKKDSFAKFENKLDKEIKNTSDQELSEFVQQFSIAGLNGDEKVFHDPKTEPKDYLKDVPASELKEFLQETADPDSDDDALMN